MPWQSKAQARWGHSEAGQKALGGSEKVAEWDASTPKGSLPDKVKKKRSRFASILGKHVKGTAPGTDTP